MADSTNAVTTRDRTLCELYAHKNTKNESEILIYSKRNVQAQFAAEASTNSQPIVGICGPTNCGKSKITQTLIHSLSGPRPLLNGEGGAVNVKSQTGDVNFYWGRKAEEEGSTPDFAILDTEGQFSSGRPAQVLLGRAWLLNHEETEDPARRAAVDTLYPKLLYAVCNVIMYVCRKPFKDTSTVDEIIHFAHAGSALVKGTSRPSLILVRNMAPWAEIAQIQGNPTENFQAFCRPETWSKLLTVFCDIQVVIIPEIRPAATGNKIRDPRAVRMRGGVPKPLVEDRILSWPHDQPLPASDPSIQRLRSVLENALAATAQERKRINATVISGRNWFPFFDTVVKSLSTDPSGGAAVLDIDEILARNFSNLNSASKCVLTIFHQLLVGISQQRSQLSIKLYHELRLSGLHYLSCVVVNQLHSSGYTLHVSDTEILKDVAVNVQRIFDEYWTATARRRPCNASTSIVGLIPVLCCSEAGRHGNQHQNFGENMSFGMSKWSGGFSTPESMLINDMPNDAEIPPLKAEDLTKWCGKEPNSSWLSENMPPVERKAHFQHYVALKLTKCKQEKDSITRLSFMAIEKLINVGLKLRASVKAKPFEGLSLLRECHICGTNSRGVEQKCSCSICQVCCSWLIAERAHGDHPICPVHKRPYEEREPLPLHLREPPPSEAGIRILSLDGGGVRGLSTALLLEWLERAVASRLGFPLQMRELFDVVVGTSTGGLLTVAVVSGIPMTKMIDVYKDLSSKVFWTKSKIRLLFHRGYSTQVLEKLLQNLLSECSVPPAHPRWATVATDITSVVGGAVTAHLIGNVDASFASVSGYKVSKTSAQFAALATAAPSFYFVPQFLDSSDGSTSTLIDGGLVLNNPSCCALDIAEHFYPIEEDIQASIASGLHITRFHQRQQRAELLVSIGTGSHELKGKAAEPSSYESIWLITEVKALAKGALQSACNTTMADLSARNRLAKSPTANYFRLNTSCERSIDFADPSKENMATIEKDTIRYIHEEKAKLDKLCETTVAALFYTVLTKAVDDSKIIVEIVPRIAVKPDQLERMKLLKFHTTVQQIFRGESSEVATSVLGSNRSDCVDCRSFPIQASSQYVLSSVLLPTHSTSLAPALISGSPVALTTLFRN